MTKEQQIRERLEAIIKEHCFSDIYDDLMGSDEAADAIMREFALRPVSQGKVDSETGEVT